MKPKYAYLLFIVTLLLSGFFSFLPIVRTQEVKGGNITFQENSIPDVNVYYENHTFVFELVRPQKTFFIRVEPFVIHDGKFYNMTQIIKYLKNQGWFEGNYQKLIEKATNAIHYGFNLTKLPQNVADKIDYLGFRLVDLNFSLSWMSLDTFEVNMDENGEFIEPYNVTHIRIEKANLILSFEDLYPFGYSVEHVNSTYVLVGNVKGKTDLIVDPITLSGSRIIVTGTYNDLCEDILSADQAGGWGVHFKQGDNQYWTNASVQLGNGTVAGTTTAYDDNIQWEIGDSTNNNGLTVCNYATLTLGDSGAPQDGGSIIINGGGAVGAPSSWRWYGTSNFYGVKLHKTTLTYLNFYGTDTWENVIVSGAAKIAFRASSAMFTCVFSPFIEVGSTNYVFEDCIFERTASGGEVFRVASSYNATIQNSDIINNHASGYEINHWQTFTGILNVTDCTTDPTKWNWKTGANGTTNYQFTFNLKTIFENNTAIQNANVTVWHVNGTQIFTELTNSTGQIAEKTLIKSQFTGEGTETNYNPYNLTITFTDYQTYTENFTLSEKTEWTIALTEDAAPTYTSAILIGALFIGVPVVALFLFWRHEK